MAAVTGIIVYGILTSALHCSIAPGTRHKHAPAISGIGWRNAWRDYIVHTKTSQKTGKKKLKLLFTLFR
jgi:hypothetical protein